MEVREEDGEEERMAGRQVAWRGRCEIASVFHNQKVPAGVPSSLWLIYLCMHILSGPNPQKNLGGWHYICCITFPIPQFR